MHELTKEKERLNNELHKADKLNTLIKSKEVNETLIQPYVKDLLDKLLLDRSLETDLIKLAYIDRQIDSISMFRRYLANIEYSVIDIKNQIQQINLEIGQ